MSKSKAKSAIRSVHGDFSLQSKRHVSQCVVRVSSRSCSPKQSPSPTHAPHRSKVTFAEFVNLSSESRVLSPRRGKSMASLNSSASSSQCPSIDGHHINSADQNRPPLSCPTERVSYPSVTTTLRPDYGSASLTGVAPGISPSLVHFPEVASADACPIQGPSYNFREDPMASEADDRRPTHFPEASILLAAKPQSLLMGDQYLLPSSRYKHWKMTVHTFVLAQALMLISISGYGWSLVGFAAFLSRVAHAAAPGCAMSVPIAPTRGTAPSANPVREIPNSSKPSSNAWRNLFVNNRNTPSNVPSKPRANDSVAPVPNVTKGRDSVFNRLGPQGGTSVAGCSEANEPANCGPNPVPVVDEIISENGTVMPNSGGWELVQRKKVRRKPSPSRNSSGSAHVALRVAQENSNMVHRARLPSPPLSIACNISPPVPADVAGHRADKGKSVVISSAPSHLASKTLDIPTRRKTLQHTSDDPGSNSG
ncbi:hypothetical protein D5086_027158 [Populus alba]|uniref:Uncharacterized protein n=1 Tax=Populus alba TaxID=43335 RepID=A0ACC4B3T1_POPAL